MSANLILRALTFVVLIAAFELEVNVGLFGLIALSELFGRSPGTHLGVLYLLVQLTLAAACELFKAPVCALVARYVRDAPPVSKPWTQPAFIFAGGIGVADTALALAWREQTRLFRLLPTYLDDVRDLLRALPWLADASVQRRLPDTLVIEVKERKPVALWQYHQRLAAIDITGKVLTRERLERWNDLPILVGAGANARVRDALELIAATPLGRDVNAAVFVGGRRWDLRFKSGETLALPDQPGQARAALATFAKLDGQGPERLLGGRFTRFDLRLPGRMIVAGPAVAETLAEAEKARRAAAQAQKI
jgi:hypothetical protein